MRTISSMSVVVLSLALLLACLSLGAAQPASAPADTDLARRVAALEAKVAELEKREAAQPHILYTPMANTSLLPVVPATGDVPPGAEPRQFNGMTYYVLPLQH